MSKQGETACGWHHVTVVCLTDAVSLQVRYVGQSIGAVVGTSPDSAKLGASVVQVEYSDIVPPVVTIDVSTTFLFVSHYSQTTLTIDWLLAGWDSDSVG